MSHPKPPSVSIEEILGTLTADTIARVTDAGVRRELENTRRFATGTATVLLAGESDPHTGALARQLGELHVTLDDVRGLVHDAMTLLAQHEERLKKEAAFHAAVALAAETEHEIHEHLGGYANLLRGKLGSKSDQLARFGVAALLPGRHRAAASAGTTPANTPHVTG